MRKLYILRTLKPLKTFKWWAREDSNLRPMDYEGFG